MDNTISIDALREYLARSRQPVRTRKQTDTLTDTEMSSVLRDMIDVYGYDAVQAMLEKLRP